MNWERLSDFVLTFADTELSTCNGAPVISANRRPLVSRCDGDSFCLHADKGLGAVLVGTASELVHRAAYRQGETVALEIRYDVADPILLFALIEIARDRAVAADRCPPPASGA